MFLLLVFLLPGIVEAANESATAGVTEVSVTQSPPLENEGRVYGHSCENNADICDPINNIVCSSGKCVDLSRACDGVRDCSDGMDEHPSHCNTTKFGCKFYNGSEYTKISITWYDDDHWFVSCKEDAYNDYYSSGGKSMTCEGGKWPHTVPYCAPCGIIKYHPDEFLSSLTKEQIALTQTPWHIGLYEVVNGKYVYVCSGTLIAPVIVLTNDACVKDNKRGKMGSLKRLKVLAGKYYKDWYRYECTVQESDVLKVFTKWNKPDLYYSNNVAMLYLTKRFDFNVFVQPACVKGKYLSDNITQAEVIEWIEGVSGTYSKSLHKTVVSLHRKSKCLESIHSIKMQRANDLCVSGLQGGDNEGAGVIVKRDSKFFVVGVISSKTGPPSKHRDELSVVTNVRPHFSLITRDFRDAFQVKSCLYSSGRPFYCLNGDCLGSNVICDGDEDCSDGTDETEELCLLIRGPEWVYWDNPQVNWKGDPEESHSGGVIEPEVAGSCYLPDLAGGSYLHTFCQGNDHCPQLSKKYLANGTSTTIHCLFGFESSLKGHQEEEFTCLNSGWTPITPDCIKLCTLQENDELAATCSYNGEDVSCDHGVPANGTVRFQCKPHYKPYLKTNNTWLLTCEKNGTWSDQYPTCIPDCGHPNIINEAKPVITGGQTTKYGRYPWHIALFKYFEHNGTFVNICGGTLISRRIVLTAAHCVVKRETLEIIKYDFLKVSAGKFTRPWDILDEFSQRNNVKKVFFPKSYSANENFYDHDIALIMTDINFKLNNFVLPACIEIERHSVPQNSVGLMLGWGMTDDDNFAEELREVELPYIDLLSCRERYKFFTRFLTFDKFCVIYEKGSGVQEGDSGGGITFPRNNVYFVEGVVSLKPRGKNIFSTFTNVSEHVFWLTNTLSVMGFRN